MPFQCTSNAPNAKLKFWLNIFRVAKKKKGGGVLCSGVRLPVDLWADFDITFCIQVLSTNSKIYASHVSSE